MHDLQPPRQEARRQGHAGAVPHVLQRGRRQGRVGHIARGHDHPSHRNSLRSRWPLVSRASRVDLPGIPSQVGQDLVVGESHRWLHRNKHEPHGHRCALRKHGPRRGRSPPRHTGRRTACQELVRHPSMSSLSRIYAHVASLFAVLAWARSSTTKQSAVALAQICCEHRRGLVTPIYKPRSQNK